MYKEIIKIYLEHIINSDYFFKVPGRLVILNNLCICHKCLTYKQLMDKSYYTCYSPDIPCRVCGELCINLTKNNKELADLLNNNTPYTNDTLVYVLITLRGMANDYNRLQEVEINVKQAFINAIYKIRDQLLPNLPLELIL